MASEPQGKPNVGRDLIDSGPRWLQTLADSSMTPQHSDEDRVRRRSLTMSAAIGATIVLPWALFYLGIGLGRVAVYPLFYVVVSVTALIYAARTKRIGFLLNSQIAMFSILPVLVHIGLGGFVNSSAAVMYASAGVIGALAYATARRAAFWFATFVIAVLTLALFDARLAASAPYVPPGIITTFFAVNIVAMSIISFLTLDIYVRSRSRLAQELRDERSRSDRLLLNVLPEAIAQRLKDGEEPIADRHDHVAVLFVDIVDFTPLSESIDADELVKDLNALYSEFDRLVVRHGAEKVKTIGDAFMAMSGTIGQEADTAAIVALALDMQRFASTASIGQRRDIQMRAGVDVGPVVAGVIGESRFIYDVYGETVNMASRMESHGIPGKVQVTLEVRNELDGRYEFTSRGQIDIKGVGEVETFLVGEQTHGTKPATLPLIER